MMDREVLYNWYSIPGFVSYEINYYTGEIRSCKHFNCGFHIMTVSKTGRVKITDDAGVSRSMKVADLYDLTFKSGNKLMPRRDNEIYCGGMRRVNQSLAGLMTPNPTKPERRVNIKLGPNGSYYE